MLTLTLGAGDLSDVTRLALDRNGRDAPCQEGYNEQEHTIAKNEPTQGNTRSDGPNYLLIHMDRRMVLRLYSVTFLGLHTYYGSGSSLP